MPINLPASRKAAQFDMPIGAHNSLFINFTVFYILIAYKFQKKHIISSWQSKKLEIDTEICLVPVVRIV